MNNNEIKEEDIFSENDIFDEDISNENDKKFQVKDLVFLAIISSITLLTSAFMPLVAHVPVFGIIQIVLGLQFSLFPAIGLMKVRRFGTMTFIALFSGIVLLFMNTIMFFCLLLCAILAEVITFIIFRGYKTDKACFLTAWLYLPLSLPFLYVWYQIIGGEDTVASYANQSPMIAIIMSLCVIVLCAIGSLLGVKISREMKRAGVLKK